MRADKQEERERGCIKIGRVIVGKEKERVVETGGSPCL